MTSDFTFVVIPVSSNTSRMTLCSISSFCSIYPPGFVHLPFPGLCLRRTSNILDRKSTRLNSSHVAISYAVFCLKKKKTNTSEERYNEYNIDHAKTDVWRVQ